MKTDFKTESFYEKENQCAQLFSKNGPFWHLCTNGQNSFIIFAEEADYDIGLALLAATACLFPDITILTFEFMSNHIHILLSGRKDRCFDFFDYFKSKLIRTWKKSGKIVNWEEFNMELYAIQDLKYLRTIIAYINRNAFLKNSKYTPYTYPWGGGQEFFRIRSREQEPVSFKNLTIKSKRQLLRSRISTDYDKLRLKNGHIDITSFCNIQLAEMMFTDAKSYAYWISKSVEYSKEIADMLKDMVILSDDELFRIACDYVSKQYEKDITALDDRQKVTVAIALRIKYKARLSALKRILRMEMSALKEIFPDVSE